MVFKDFTANFRRGITDATGIDFGRTATKAVRLRRVGDVFSVTAAEVLPPAIDGHTSSFSLPLRLKARHAAITTDGHDAIAKLITFPGAVDKAFESNLAKTLGLDSSTGDRMAYHVVTEGSGRAESRVLAVSMPESEAMSVMRFFTSGLPAPLSLEIAPIAALTAFEAGPVRHSTEPAVGLLDFGTTSSTLSIFYKKTLVLIRRFDFGTRKLLERIGSVLHVDPETALNILADSAFDISEPVTDVMGPLSSQLVVSRDFVERRENCTIRNLHIIGGIAASEAAISEMARALNLDIHIWDPFSIPSLQCHTLDPAIDRWRFAAAIGAALGILEEKA